MTRWPFLVLIRTRKPDTLFLLRLVPPRVRCVIFFFFVLAVWVKQKSHNPLSYHPFLLNGCLVGTFS